MILSNIDFNVLYVDPSASTAGDGGTPATALTSLPTSSSDVADNTCYIIRRTSSDYEVQLPQGENTAITALAILGMPKTGDELLSLMPEEAKAAWGEDADDYANIKAVTRSDAYGSTTLGLALPNCLTFFLYRVNLYRDSLSAFEAAIQLTNENQTGSASIERCRFGLKNFALENGACNSTPSTGAAMYIQVNKPEVFSLRHCVINSFLDSTYYFQTSSWGIYVQSAAFANVSDVDVWCGTGASSTTYSGSSDAVVKIGYYSTSSGSYSKICNCVNVDNLRAHYVKTGSNGSLPRILYVYATEFTAIRNITLDMVDYQFGTGTTTLVTPAGILIDSEGATEYIYENLTATLPDVWKVPSGCNIFKLCGQSSSGLPGCAKRINNINITLGTNSGVDTSGNGNYYSDYQSTSTDTWKNYAALCLCIGSEGSNEPVIVRKVSVTHPRGIAMYAENCYLKAGDLQGMLRTSKTTCDITSLTTWYPGYAIGATNGSTIRVGTLNLGKGNIASHDSDPAILGSPQENTTFIYIGTCNGPLMSDTRSTSTSYNNCYAVICANEQDTGHYTMRTINGMCNTWGVVRTGSSLTASLKLSNNTADGTGFMSLGRQPFGGFSLAASSGEQTLKVYVATKALTETAEIARRLVAQVTIPQSDGSQEMVFSSTRGRWTTDESVWIGESGLSGFLLEMPLNIPAACNVDVKFHFKWYSSGGYLYIDPDMKFEATTLAE